MIKGEFPTPLNVLMAQRSGTVSPPKTDHCIPVEEPFRGNDETSRGKKRGLYEVQ